MAETTTSATHEQVEPSNCVYVSNISPKANERTVMDFFSFCGKIKKLVLLKGADDALQAIVTFETEEAAKTALLLTNALIVDRAISVSPQETAHSEPVQTTTLEGEQITQKPHVVEPSERTSTSVIASLIAAGYKLGTDIIQRAKDYDEKHSITSTIKSGAEKIKTTAQDLDKKFHVTETATAIKNAAVDKVHEIDEKYHVSETVGKGVEKAKEELESVQIRIKENPTLSSGIDTLRRVGSSVTTKVKSTLGVAEAPPSEEQGERPKVGQESHQEEHLEVPHEEHKEAPHEEHKEAPHEQQPQQNPIAQESQEKPQTNVLPATQEVKSANPTQDKEKPADNP